MFKAALQQPDILDGWLTGWCDHPWITNCRHDSRLVSADDIAVDAESLQDEIARQVDNSQAPDSACTRLHWLHILSGFGSLSTRFF